MGVNSAQYRRNYPNLLLGPPRFIEIVNTSLQLTSQLVLPAYRILTPELGFVC